MLYKCDNCGQSTDKPAKTLTKDDVSQDLKSSVRAYLLARTYSEVQTEKIAAIETEILATAKYKTDERWVKRGYADRITDPKHAYLLDDDEFQEYLREKHERLIKLGYKITEFGRCPALVAQSLQHKAEALLIDAIGAMMGIDGFDAYGERRQQLIDLSCKLVVNLPDFKNPLTGE